MKFFVLAGTKDGRELAKAIKENGHEVLLSALTEYGANIATGQELETRFGALDEQELKQILIEGKYQALVDATHPYAQNIKPLAQRVCKHLNIPYYRWQRASTPIKSDGIYWVNDIPEGAELASQLGKRILLTTGSHTLDQWVNCDCLKSKELLIRVLPTFSVLKRCEELGFKPYQIIGAQGPFSKEFNQTIIKDLHIDVVVAKESGKEGGTPEKIEACLNLKVPLILIKRPNQNEEIQHSEPQSFSEFVQKLTDLYI